MADYTAAQKSITATFDSDVEVITLELQKIQFASSGRLKLTRSDKLRIRHTGGYADVELVYDGKAVSLYGNSAKAFVQTDAPGTINQLVGVIEERIGGAMPGADLLLSNSYEVLISDVIEGRHVGQGSLAESNASISHLAGMTPIGRSGYRPVPSRCLANM